ncbi:MAG: GT4 family glycosyltransferase PelF [Candidatus Omnitrophica bacterium]|nr:GT4 family glycosyltransferase PelF [Candidatus Omnitrophota bacterium]
MKVAHVIVGGEVAGGQVICERIIEALRRQGDLAIVVSPTGGNFAERLMEKQIPVHLIPFRKTYHVQNAFRFARLLKQEQVDIVHTHAMVQVNVQARLGARLAAVPLISHMHLPNHFRNHRLIRAYQILLDNWTAQLCDELIAVSESTREALTAQGSAYRHAKIIYNGIDVDRCHHLKNRDSILKKLGLKPVHQIVGMVGRLCPVKGQKEFIQAAKEVSVQIPEAVFVLVGNDVERHGAYESQLRKVVSELGLNEKVIFTGYRSDALDLIHAFDVFVLPSKIEGLPVTILEAMALKKPVVATSVGGVPEIVVDEKTGLLVPPNDVLRLSQSILRLLRNPGEAMELGEEGYEYVKQKFSEKKMMEQILAIYEQVIKARNSNNGSSVGKF